jgi:hypothetical protein
MKAIFIVGTSHNAYQVRPQNGPPDGADAFKRYLQQVVQSRAMQTIAEEMSNESPQGRQTVGHEVAEERHLSHLLCDPDSSERIALGISKADTDKRELEWLRRLTNAKYPVLFVCGATHVDSFVRHCQKGGLASTIEEQDFEVPLPLEARII